MTWLWFGVKVWFAASLPVGVFAGCWIARGNRRIDSRLDAIEERQDRHGGDLRRLEATQTLHDHAVCGLITQRNRVWTAPSKN